MIGSFAAYKYMDELKQLPKNVKKCDFSSNFADLLDEVTTSELLASGLYNAVLTVSDEDRTLDRPNHQCTVLALVYHNLHSKSRVTAEARIHFYTSSREEHRLTYAE